MSMTFEQSRAAELAALTQAGESIRSAPALAELFSLGATALDRIMAALRDNLVSAEEARQWGAKFDALEDERLAEL